MATGQNFIMVDSYFNYL